MNAMPRLLCLYLTICGIPMLSRSAVFGEEEPPRPSVLEWIDLRGIVQELTGSVEGASVQERHANHWGFGFHGSGTALGSRHGQWWTTGPVPAAERAVFRQNFISAIEGAIGRRGARLCNVSRGDETFESTTMFTYVVKRTGEADLMGSLTLSLCRLGEDVRVNVSVMEVETDIVANMARQEQMGKTDGSFREFWEAEPTAEDRKRGDVNKLEAAQQRLSRERHAANNRAAHDRLDGDDLVGMLGIRYYKSRVLLPPGQNRLRLRIVKTGPGEAEVIREYPFHFRPATIDPNGIKLLLYFVDEEGSPVGAEMVNKNGETRYVISLRAQGRNEASGPRLSDTLAWLPPGSDMTRGDSNECHPVDLRSAPEQMFLSFSRGEHTLEFRMTVDDAGGSK